MAGFDLQPLQELDEKPQEWAWDGLIPMGKLTLLTGASGMGKSMVACQAASIVTRGWRPTPKPQPKPVGAAVDDESDEQPAKQPEAAAVAARPKYVVYLSADDDPATILKPRLRAARAEISRVFILRAEPKQDEEDLDKPEEDSKPGGRGKRSDVRKPLLARLDLPGLEKSLQTLKEEGKEVGMIVIDSLDPFLLACEKKRERLELVVGLNALATTTGAAVLVVANPPKANRGRPEAWSLLENQARGILTILPSLEVRGQRLMLPAKMNLCDMGPGWPFSIENGTVKWDDEPVWMSPEEHAVQTKLLARNPLMGEEYEKAPKFQQVTRWLREQLLPGRASSNWVRGTAGSYRVAYSVLRRAFKAIGGLTMKEKTGQWFWYLPGHPNTACDEILERPIDHPEGIKGISREFCPDNFTCWSLGRDPADAKFAGAPIVDEPPLGTRERWDADYMVPMV